MESTDITLITCGEEPRLERIGNIPGLARLWTSFALVGGRFAAGLGATGSADLWVFDVQAGRAAVVWESGDWALDADRPFLTVQGGTLYIINTDVYALSLQSLPGLMDDDAVRDAFCDFLGAWRAPKYVPPPPGAWPSGGVTFPEVGLPHDPRSTFWHRGRLLHFSSSGSEFLVLEAVFHGGKARLAGFRTGIACAGPRVCCCPFGDRFLVVGGEERVSAALVDVGRGRVSAKTVHATPLTVTRDARWGADPCLTWSSGNRFLLYFSAGNSLWYCDLAGNGLSMRKLQTEMPTEDGFSCLPLRLPDGRFLVAGSDPESTDVTLITCGGERTFEKIGTITGQLRTSPSLILLRDRFVVGRGRGLR